MGFTVFVATISYHSLSLTREKDSTVEAFKMRVSSLVTLVLAAASSSAHPGEDVEKERAIRREFLAMHTNNLDHCTEQLEASGVHSRAIQRRAEMAKHLTKRAMVEGLPQ